MGMVGDLEKVHPLGNPPGIYHTPYSPPFLLAPFRPHGTIFGVKMRDFGSFHGGYPARSTLSSSQ